MAWASLDERGVRRPGEQLGQSGHPRPEPLSRTAPPVMMMMAKKIVAAKAIRWKALGLMKLTQVA